MHQGQIATLTDVLRHYNTLENSVFDELETDRVLKPLGFTNAELADLEAFLNALTDEEIDPVLTLPLKD